MKKITLFFFLLCVSLSARAFVINGIGYKITSVNTPYTVEVAKFDTSTTYYSDNIEIPSTVTYSDTTYSVTSVGRSAFRGCSKFKSIVIPNSVTTIGNGAFGSCLGLVAITIPNSVSSIGESAFNCCISLLSITIPGSVTAIGKSAFSYCYALTTINIINSEAYVGSSAFYKCTNLTFIKTPSYEAFAWSSTKIQSLIITNDSITPAYATDISKSFGTLQYLDIEGTKNKNLPANMLYNCFKLESLKLPKQLVNISSRSMLDCMVLKTIDIPATVTNIGMQAFENCRSLKKVTFESGSKLKTIGERAFYACHALDSINIPTGVITIGNNAFWSCDNMKSLNLPSSVSDIGDYAFDGCTSIGSMQVDATTPPTVQGNTFNQVNKSISVKVPKTSLDLYKTAFVWKDFSYLTETSIDIPDYNPVNCFIEDGNIVLTGARPGLRLIISDLQGRQLYNQIILADNIRFKLARSGVYLVNIGGETKKVIF